MNKKNANKEKKNLTQEIAKLEENYDCNLETLEEKKNELDSRRQHKLMGILIRSRAKWINEGENQLIIFLIFKIEILQVK